MSLPDVATGNADADRVLLAIIENGRSRVPARVWRDWYGGRIQGDIYLSHLAQASGVAADQVPTVLAFLELGGWIQADHELHPGRSVRIRLGVGRALRVVDG